MLAPVELDDDAAVGPEAVDGPGAEGLVSQRELDRALDEQPAEAALEPALRFAVAGRVVSQCSAQIGAARVPAAQRALDVRRA